MDSNHDKELQRLLCYHYTTGQGRPKLALCPSLRKEKVSGIDLVRVTVIEQFKGQQENDRQEYRANEPGSARNDHPRTTPGADELTDTHRESHQEIDLAADQEKRERTQVAGEVHYL